MILQDFSSTFYIYILIYIYFFFFFCIRLFIFYQRFFFSSLLFHLLHHVLFSKEECVLAHLRYILTISLSLSLSLTFIRSSIHSLIALPSAYITPLIACNRYSLSSIFTRCFLITFQNPTCLFLYIKKKIAIYYT